VRAAMDKRETRRFEIGGKYTEAWYQNDCFLPRQRESPSWNGDNENKKIEEALREADSAQERILSGALARTAQPTDPNQKQYLHPGTFRAGWRPANALGDDSNQPRPHSWPIWSTTCWT